MKKTLLAGAIFASLLTAGCIDVSGGGWIVSSMGEPAKATFGFNFDCRTFTDRAWGNITYHDHGLSTYAFNGIGTEKTKFAINGVVTNFDAYFGLCLPFLQPGGDYAVTYNGTYMPIPPTLGPGGDVRVTVYDTGVRGPDKGDWVEIQLSGGVFDGYYWGGNLMGGNISFNN